MSQIALPFEYGVVTKVVPSKGGCLVRPEGYTYSFAWSWDELELVSEIHATRFERV